MEGSKLGDLECGSVQVENNRARSARSSYRFGNLSWKVIAKPFRLPLRTPFSPGRCPGLLSGCTFGAQNLEPQVPAPFGLWHAPVQPNLRGLRALAVNGIRILDHEGHEEHEGRIGRDVRAGFFRTHQQGPTMINSSVRESRGDFGEPKRAQLSLSPAIPPARIPILGPFGLRALRALRGRKTRIRLDFEHTIFVVKNNPARKPSQLEGIDNDTKGHSISGFGNLTRLQTSCRREVPSSLSCR